MFSFEYFKVLAFKEDSEYLPLKKKRRRRFRVLVLD